MNETIHIPAVMFYKTNFLFPSEDKFVPLTANKPYEIVEQTEKYTSIKTDKCIVKINNFYFNQIGVHCLIKQLSWPQMWHFIVMSEEYSGRVYDTNLVLSYNGKTRLLWKEENKSEYDIICRGLKFKHGIVEHFFTTEIEGTGETLEEYRRKLREKENQHS